MTDAQLFGLYAIERIEGYPKFEPLDEGPSIGAESFYRDWLRVKAGITDLRKQLAFWAAERRKRAQWQKEHDERAEH